ncbi:MAG: ABC transporter substrate-binding protein [Actinomycetota bacterium]
MRPHAGVAVTVLALLAVACGARVEPQAGVVLPGGQVIPTTDSSLPVDLSPGATAGAAGGPGPNVPGAPNVPPAEAGCLGGGATDVGVKADRIDIGLVAAKTGPLPGQFNSTIEAVDAYVKMLNAERGGICGRRVVLHVRDDAGNQGNNERLARELAEEVKIFAFVGSVSAPDSDTGVAKVSRDHRLVDIGFPLTYARSESPYTYGVPGQLQRRKIGAGSSGIPYLNRTHGIKQMAILWLGEALVSRANAWAFEAAAMRAAGSDFRICFERETSTLDNNFQSYAISLKGRCPPSGGPLAIYTTMENSSNIKLATALKDQGVEYEVFAPTFTSYLPSFVRDERGRPRVATEGAYMALPQIPFERCAGFDSRKRPVPPCAHPELDRYVRSLRRYVPNFRAPGSFGAPGWGMADLFATAARACGAQLTRACLRQKIDALPSFTANGFLAPARPSAHEIYHADLLVRVRNGRFVEQPQGDPTGPAEAPDFWDDSMLIDWWEYFCANKTRFPSRAQIDAFVTSC